MPSDYARVADRYLHGDQKITITEIEFMVHTDGVRRSKISYSILDEGSRTPRHSFLVGPAIPTVPREWTLVGRGPEEAQYCVNHPLREREVGTMYCPECVDQQATSWAGLTPGHAEAKYAALLKEQG